MQVTNSAVIVDYFPEAFIAESDDIKGMKVVIKRFIKRVYFRATGQRSYSTVVATDAKNDWQSRINNGGRIGDLHVVNSFDSLIIHENSDHTTGCVPVPQLVLSLHQLPTVGLTPITFALGLRAVAVSLASR